MPDDDPRLEPAEFYGWSGYRMSNDRLELGFAPDIGGRLISLKYHGRELLFHQAEHAGESFDPNAFADVDAMKQSLGFRLWGGDKTWVAPQSDWRGAIPPLDLDACRYAAEMKDHRVFMLSPLDRETGLRVARTFELRPDGRVAVVEEFRNPGDDETIRRGIWNVSQLLRPAVVYAAVEHDRVLAYENEGRSVELRDVVVQPAGDWTRIDCPGPAHFKYGGRLRNVNAAGAPERGELLSVQTDPKTKTAVAMHRSFAIESKGAYTHDAIFEVYNSPSMDYLEVEVHAPLRDIPPGSSVSLEQIWTFAEVDAGAGPQEIRDALVNGGA